ncbi:MAG: SMODS domain-containing nucleotidyltransferase [Bacteroidota bacterium]
MHNIFNTYEIRREELLARIAQQLELDSTRRERMESAYNAVYDLLKKDEDFFDDIEIELYAQGSTRIGTPVKPINGDDFDLDVVLHIFELYTDHDPVKVYNALVKALEKSEYYKSILEKKPRCVRLNYKGDFHMDILPGCMRTAFDKEKIAIPEKNMRDWSSGNPKGFSKWFLDIANSVKSSVLEGLRQKLMLKAQIEQEDLPDDDVYSKTPLQRSVQLIKRYRDIYFQNKDYAVSSIVLTTLMGHFYNQQDSIYQTIDEIMEAIREEHSKSIRTGIRFQLKNPVNPDEIFTDSWTDAHYKAFYDFIDDFYTKWNELKNDFDMSGKAYIALFGEGQYKESLRRQIKLMSQFDGDDLTKTNGLILGGTAYTDRDGRITENTGWKNERHHNFGG